MADFKTANKNSSETNIHFRHVCTGVTITKMENKNGKPHHSNMNSQLKTTLSLTYLGMQHG